MTEPNPHPFQNLTDCVEAYEQAIADGVVRAIEDCLPAPSHNEYSQIVVELVRVEMERLGWQQDSMIDEYCARFPAVFADPICRSLIAFEEFRVRRQHGEAVTRQQYAERFRIDTEQWPSVASNPDISLIVAEESASHRRKRSGPSVVEMDVARVREFVKGSFPEFETIEELGKGAFGRVFLARQKDLADRLVVIKVTSDTTAEPERLAKLQHTNIVPVYSVHRTDEWQAICMPFFGRLTLQSISKDAIPNALMVVKKVAEGLHHAHMNGILHRDVKPANILMTDDGQPMLLDFNLSSDLTSRSLRRSLVGGTIPYLAPEQLESLQSGQAVAATADIYSLGVILFELLVGRLPFEPSPSSTLSNIVQKAKDRSPETIPCVRDFVPTATWAVQDILLKCLQPQPENRYQSAAELAEDLQCELSDRPLMHAGNSSMSERFRKWRRRHPRLLSVSSLLAVLALVLITVGIRFVIVRDRLAFLQSQSQWQQFRDAVPAVRTLLSAPDGSAPVLAEGLREGSSLVHQYRVAESADWHNEPQVQNLSAEAQAGLDEELSEIVFLLASATHRLARLTQDETEQQGFLLDALRWNELNGRFFSAQKSRHSWNIQRIGIRSSLGTAQEKEISELPLLSKESGQLTAFSNAIQQLELGDPAAATMQLEFLVQQNPHDYSAWFLLGKSRAMLGQNWEANAAYSTCIAFNSNCWLAWQERAIVRLALGQFKNAADDCTRLLELRPDIAAGHLNRALAEISLGDYSPAIQDLDETLAKNGPSRAFFLRASVRQMQGDSAGAQADIAQGLKSTPADCDSWVARGMAHLADDPKQALADFQQAILLDRRCRDALQNSAHVLSERLSQPAEAIRCLDDLLGFYPDDQAARIGRAVLNARAGTDETARQDAEIVLRQLPDPVTQYQVACVFSLLSQRTAKDAEHAVQHFSTAMTAQPQLYLMAENDPDLKPLHDLSRFRQILNACRDLLNPESVTPNAGLPAQGATASNGE